MHTGHPICVLARVLALTFALCPAPAPAGSVLGQAITQPAHPAPPLTNLPRHLRIYFHTSPTTVLALNKIKVSFCVVARDAPGRITRFVRAMAMVLSNDTNVLFFCLPSIKRPIWILRGKAILGVQYAYWTFMKSSMHIGHFIMSSLHTGLDEIPYANWTSSMHIGQVFKWSVTYMLIVVKVHLLGLRRAGLAEVWVSLMDAGRRKVLRMPLP